MSNHRNKKTDKEATRLLILDPNRPNYSGGANWLGHGVGRSDGLARVDELLLDGATMKRLKQERGGISSHFASLKRDHDLLVTRNANGVYQFDRQHLGIALTPLIPAAVSPMWAVSAALLLNEREPIRLEELAERVMATRLSKLGLRNVDSDNSATLGTALRYNCPHPDWFSVDRNCVELVDKAAATKDRKVQAILSANANRQSILDDSVEIAQLKRELGELESRPRVPEVLREIQRVLKTYERPSRITQYVKRTRKPIATCQLCHQPGFRKKNGKLYCEVHHLFHLSKSPPPKCLAPEYLVVLCATCHRRMHYADVGEPVRAETGWRVRVDDAEHEFVTV